MANEKIVKLHVHALPDNLENLAGFDPHQVSLEDELFTPKKVIITLDSVIAFPLDSRPTLCCTGEFLRSYVDRKECTIARTNLEKYSTAGDIRGIHTENPSPVIIRVVQRW
jgi:hypothetical protein